MDMDIIEKKKIFENFFEEIKQYCKEQTNVSLLDELEDKCFRENNDVIIEYIKDTEKLKSNSNIVLKNYEGMFKENPLAKATFEKYKSLKNDRFFQEPHFKILYIFSYHLIKHHSQGKTADEKEGMYKKLCRCFSQLLPDTIDINFEEDQTKFIKHNVYPNIERISISDGKVIDSKKENLESMILGNILPKREDTVFLKDYQDKMKISDKLIGVAYKEIYGIQQGINFREDDNIKIVYTDEKADMEKYIINDLKYIDNPTENHEVVQKKFEELLQKELKEASKKGYKNHPPKLRLYEFLRSDTPVGSKKSHELSWIFGEFDKKYAYIESRIYEKYVVRNNLNAQHELNEILPKISSTNIFNQTHPMFARVGAGIWLVTNDNYLVVASRGNNIDEIQNQLSYSASGSVDSRIMDNNNQLTSKWSTPEKNIQREVFEELGIEIDLKNLKMISFGVDLERPLIQISYFLYLSDISKNDLIAIRPRARDKREFTMIFIPYERKFIEEILFKVKMEAGAAYSLWENMFIYESNLK